MANKLPEASPHGEELREAVARAMREHMIRVGVVKSWMEYADAALSLIQPEIDRRVAEEKAKLLERLQGLSSWLGAGSSEDAEDLENRIRWGVELQASATIQRCADVVEKLSKTPSTKWGEIKAEILTLKEQQP